MNAVTFTGGSVDSLGNKHGKVSVGVRRRGVDVKIVNPVTLEELSDGSDGEIWVSSPAIAQGYFGQAKEDEEDVFHVRLSGDAEGKVSLGRLDLER